MRITHTWTDDTASIAVEGLADTVRMLHITDAHVSLFDERVGDHIDTCRRFCEQFAAEEKDEAGNSLVPDAAFRESMAHAASMGLDLVALTGDIVHYPAEACIELVVDQVAALAKPALYTCGNHDVHFRDEPVSEEMRQAWLPTLQPLHGADPDCSVQEIGGIRFVSIDSSMCQVRPNQLDFMAEQLRAGKPVVLLTHIPLSLPTLRSPTIAKMGAPILMGDPDWSADSRHDWQVSADTPTTLEFVQLIASSSNLVAIFCGHVHYAHADALNPRAVQYVGRPGYEGGRRLVEFTPLDRS